LQVGPAFAGVTVTEFDGLLLPCEFRAVTVQLYCTPLVIAETRRGLAGPVAVRVVWPDAVQVAVKSMMAEAPLGPAKNGTDAVPLPGVGVLAVGAPGTPASIVIEKVCEALLPLVLLAPIVMG